MYIGSLLESRIKSFEIGNTEKWSDELAAIIPKLNKTAMWLQCNWGFTNKIEVKI